MPRPPSLSASARALRESIFSRLQGRLAPGGVPLHLGDTYLPPPVRAKISDGDPALWRYGAPAGEGALLAALAKKSAARNGLAWAAPANLQITCGATQALAAAVRAIIDPGDEVIVPTPHWPLIRGIVTNAGGVAVEVPLSQQLYADPSLDAAALIEPHLTERTAALYVTTPNNPDGKVLSLRHLEQLAALARARDLWVLSDEVYEDLNYVATQQPQLSVAALPGMAERTITVFSLSKSYALAGFRLGYAVAAEAPMRALRKIANHTVYNVPDVLQRAALAVVEDPASAEWLANARATYLAARDRAAALTTAPHFLPDGATYLFVDLTRFSRADGIWPLVEKLLDAGVSISPGEQFGRGFEHHARLCFTAVEPARLELGLARLAEVLAQ